jgi:hypothetical protein
MSILLMCDALAGCGQSSGVAPTTSTAAYPAFSNPTQVAIMGYTGDAMEPFISKDGRYLFFNSRNDPSVNTDIYYAARVDDQTFTFLGPLPGVNSPELDAVASLDSLGNFYFVSTRSYATTLSTIYSGQFSRNGVNAVAPGISLQQPGWVNFDAEISADAHGRRASALFSQDGERYLRNLPSAALDVGKCSIRRLAKFVHIPNRDALTLLCDRCSFLSGYADDLKTHDCGAVARDEPANASFFLIGVGKTRLTLAQHFGQIAVVPDRK